MWKQQVNDVLRRATGYQLEKARPTPPAGPPKPQARKPKAAKPKPQKRKPARYDDEAEAIMAGSVRAR